MYRESINLLAFIAGLFIMLAAGMADAAPLQAEDMDQVSILLIIIGCFIAAALGFIAGQQR